MLLLKDSSLRFQEVLVAEVGFLSLLKVPAEILHLLIMPFMTGGSTGSSFAQVPSGGGEVPDCGT